jgi:hypothetical protein
MNLVVDRIVVSYIVNIWSFRVRLKVELDSNKTVFYYKQYVFEDSILMIN